MNAVTRISVEADRLSNALGRFPRDRAAFDDGRWPQETASNWTRVLLMVADSSPFGGYRQSGIGDELGRNAVRDYTEE